MSEIQSYFLNRFIPQQLPQRPVELLLLRASSFFAANTLFLLFGAFFGLFRQNSNNLFALLGRGANQAPFSWDFLPRIIRQGYHAFHAFNWIFSSSVVDLLSADVPMHLGEERCSLAVLARFRHQLRALGLRLASD